MKGNRGGGGGKVLRDSYIYYGRNSWDRDKLGKMI